MNNPLETLKNTLRWVSSNIFAITIPVFICYYIRWFRLTPFTVEDVRDDHAFAFLVGCILLLIYGFSVKAYSSKKNNPGLNVAFVFINLFVLLINFFYLNAFIPKMKATVRCNRTTYYLTVGVPVDEQFTYTHIAGWKGYSQFISRSGGYGSSGPSKIICDEKNKEAHFVDPNLNFPKIVFTDGSPPRQYPETSGVKLRNHLYFVSSRYFVPESCRGREFYECHSTTYILYECETNFTSCKALPIQYTSDSHYSPELRVDRNAGEISLYEMYRYDREEVLVFTYGKNPRCFAENCSITSQ